MIIVIMGVTGCGKSTIGKLLAQKFSLPFIEADEFHSKENVAKMSSGIPLNDEDRYPWLQSLSEQLQSHEKTGAILACSALKERYREILQKDLNEKIVWIYLDGSETTLQKRIERRTGHFMPGTLLKSQLEVLEKPVDAYLFSIENDPETISNEIVNTIKNNPANH
ncbi:MAG TPA: gluconokinase [Flavisolibacter sp.]|jgi:carbohydrate kinase (thermoresistant glucokinase family)|nr:gluconokinase [Flavisolibacter sp.]